MKEAEEEAEAGESREETEATEEVAQMEVKVLWAFGHITPT